jgi:hypothetical protein
MWNKEWFCMVSYHVEWVLHVRFQVLTMVSMKMIAFWDIAPRSLIVVDRHFRGAYCLHHQGDEWRQDAPLKHQKYYNETTRCNISEGYQPLCFTYF